MKMYSRYTYNSAVSNSDKFMAEYRLSLQMVNLQTQIDLNTQQYNYQADLLERGKIPAANGVKNLQCLGAEIQNDKLRLVQLGKEMAQLKNNINPNNYRPKF